MAGHGAARTLIIGLDVGDGALLRQWAEAGHLPAIARLLDRGAWTTLDTPASTLHVASWPSIYTGAEPGEHGVYFTFQAAPGLQGYRKFAGDQYGVPTFWNVLSQAGVQCTVFDAPYTHPEPGSAARQIFEWGTWAHHWTPMSTPAPLFKQLNRACGGYPLGVEALDWGLAPYDAADMSRRLVVSADAKARATRWLMEQSPWDLFFVVFGETHPGTHYAWAPPDHAAMRSVYQAIDRGIGALADSVGEDTALWIVSGDGAGPNYAGWHLLPEVLRRLGYLAEPSEQPSAEGAATASNGARLDPIRRLRDALPKDLRKQIARRLLPSALRHRLARRVDMGAIDWTKTRAYCLPTDLEGYIRVNLRGREPQGIVAPGAEYERVCDELSAAIHALVDPVTGRPAVREVVRTDRAFPGARRDYLPDLIVVWDAVGPVEQLSSPAVGTVAMASPDGRPGTHAAPGFLLQVEPGASSIGSGHTITHVRDLAPELYRRFGVTAAR